MNDTNKYAILHCHTKTSDGALTHKEVLDICEENGIGTVAFTDHDALIPDNIFAELTKEQRTVNFISGIEISAGAIKEVEESISMLHIVGLFVDHKNEALVQFCKNAREKRLERLRKIVQNLQNVGFSVEAEKIEALAKDGTVGRPHIVRAILAEPKNELVIRTALEKLRKEGENDTKKKELYEEIKNNDSYRLMFDLFLRDDAYVPGMYVPYLEKVTLDEAVAMIRGAGGIAIMAHPTYYREKIPAELIEKLAKEGRIDGIETVYAVGERGEMEEIFAQDISAMRKIISSYGLFSSGGGDAHTREDFARINEPANKEMLDETKVFLGAIFAKRPELREKLY